MCFFFVGYNWSEKKNATGWLVTEQTKQKRLNNTPQEDKLISIWNRLWFFLLIGKKVFGLFEAVPMNLWITFEPSTILVLESAEVTSTSDGLPGVNCNIQNWAIYFAICPIKFLSKKLKINFFQEV